jgi:hypothetical protein
MDVLIRQHFGKFVAFYEGEIGISDSFEKAYRLGAKKHGDKKGFVVRELAKKKRILSTPAGG